jgi:type VI protein secretion system component VasK
MTDRPFGRRVNRIDELAQNLPPPRDLWPAIAAAIEADRAGAVAENAPRRTRWLPAAGMAAAVALVTVGIFIGRFMGQDSAGTMAGTTATQPTAMLPAALRDADYRKQRDALLVEVDDRLKSMPAADREKVAASLATLRRSIGEIEAALGRDPANALLQELLVNSCQEEMRALTAVRDSGSQET